ncbi:unnamed protein product [Thlaspi arvense]|uniref:Uncharacterized protein n=1 Tax=Thlaspi arvense TaxID=13288 RepID=A0AAU9SFH4_THLAR|nr:unnamed protein product [Thlaspi arvense]
MDLPVKAIVSLHPDEIENSLPTKKSQLSSVDPLRGGANPRALRINFRPARDMSRDGPRTKRVCLKTPTQNSISSWAEIQHKQPCQEPMFWDTSFVPDDTILRDRLLKLIGAEPNTHCGRCLKQLHFGRYRVEMACMAFGHDKSGTPEVRDTRNNCLNKLKPTSEGQRFGTPAGNSFSHLM